MKNLHTLLGLLALPLAAARYAMYADQYHATNLPGKSKTAGIDHMIMAFAPSTLFSGDSPQPFTPFEPVSTMRGRLQDGAKVMIAIGGWGDTSGFSEASKTQASRAKFAKNVASMLDSVGFDGVDIDWEYAGGNGQDYKQHPNSEKVGEIDAFPELLKELKSAIGDKVLSIATPGRLVDMIAYTDENCPKIWESVDMINVMSYDIMNRRDNVTNHHTGIKDTLALIDRYLQLGAPPEKINLGFAFYAKWFTTDPSDDCTDHPIGCKTVVMENSDGSDNGKSGALTFEPTNVGPVPADLKDSPDGTCGAAKGYKCTGGACCSQYGNCGTTDEFCGTSCVAGYGTCKGTSITEAFQTAQKNSKTDEVGGGQYYYDSENHLFWTWDTPELIAQKFDEIVAPRKLGGVMAWSLGEDTYDWSHLDALTAGAKAKLGA